MLWTSVATPKPQQMKDNQEEEDYSNPYAMTTAYYSAAQSGHNMMRGGNDESPNESPYELGLEQAADRLMPPQAQAPAYDNQYMGAYPPIGWYAAPLPPASSQYNYHPTAHHSMMYPPYHVPYSSATTQYQHLQYPPNEESQIRYRRVKADFSNESSEGDFFRTGDRQRDWRSALYYARKNPSATLFDIDDPENAQIKGFIAEIAKADEGGSRFVQRRLQNGKENEKRLALQAALRSFSDLWLDPFGNFMLQGLLEVGSAEMREELMTAVFAAGVVDMTLNIHGCRVIQKALLVLDQVSVCKIITELQDIEEVIPFIFDPNGNHVIQKAIQTVSTFSKSAADHGDIDEAVNLMNQIKFIIDDVAANVEQLSKHRYGCRVIQRTIEYCPEEQRNEVLTKIRACHRSLIEDQYGNYVIQQALSIGSEDIMDAVIETLSEGDSILSFSKHKYASNVVEVMFQSASPDQKEAVLNAMLQDFEGICGIVELARDPIGNYVVKNAIDCAEGQQKEKIFAAIISNREELAKAPYAKYVLAKLGERRPSRTSRRNKGQDTPRV